MYLKSEGEPHSAALAAWQLAASEKRGSVVETGRIADGSAAAPKIFECVGVQGIIGGLIEAVPAQTHLIVVGVCMQLDTFVTNDEFCIKNEKMCIQNDAFCIQNDEFCRFKPTLALVKELSLQVRIVILK